MTPDRLSSWEYAFETHSISSFLLSTFYLLCCTFSQLSSDLIFTRIPKGQTLHIYSNFLIQPSPYKPENLEQVAHHHLLGPATSHRKSRLQKYSGSLLPLAHSPCSAVIPNYRGPCLRLPTFCSTPRRLTQKDSPQAPSSEGISGGGGWPGVLVSPAAGVMWAEARGFWACGSMGMGSGEGRTTRWQLLVFSFKHSPGYPPVLPLIRVQRTNY